jgi:threonine/homoserine/homoserine lactone efflux protein
MYIVGGSFILYLAYGAFKSWQNYNAVSAIPDVASHQTILKAAMTNALSPGTYIFWTLVTGPILLEGWQETPINGIGFLAGFYVTLVAGLAAVILVFGISQKLGPQFNKIMLGISAIALFFFGLYQLKLGIF